MEQREKRHNSRIHLTGHITIINKKRRQRICNLRDISMTGMSIVGSPGVKTGSSCHLESNLMSYGRPFSLKMAGQVVRREIEIYGIRFLAMTRETLQILQTLLLYSSLDPIRLGEEFAKGSPSHLLSGYDPFATSIDQAAIN